MSNTKLGKRYTVFERDHGICAECGIDTIALHDSITKHRHDRPSYPRFPNKERLERYHRKYIAWEEQDKQFKTQYGWMYSNPHAWEVADFDTTGMHNLRTLCVPCCRKLYEKSKAQ